MSDEIRTVPWGFDDPAEELSRVQALRADPPGLAGSGGRRAKVFGAALQQFSELLTASESVGPASSPILLFYALSQAGRAMAASHQAGGELWEFSSHGLKITEHEEVGKTTIRPEPRKDEGDAFSVVTAVTGSPSLRSSVDLASLWSSLPSLETAAGLRAGRARPLVLQPDPFGTVALTALEKRTTAVVQLPADLDDEDRAEAYLAAYPAAAGKKVQAIFSTVPDAGSSQWRPYRIEFVRPIDTISESYLSESTRYIRPSLENGHDPPLSVMTWWATLLAVASLARYRPAAWTRALDKDRSAIAIPLENGLRAARTVLPRLVLHGLTGRWT